MFFKKTSYLSLLAIFSFFTFFSFALAKNTELLPIPKNVKTLTKEISPEPGQYDMRLQPGIITYMPKKGNDNAQMRIYNKTASKWNNATKEETALTQQRFSDIQKFITSGQLSEKTELITLFGQGGFGSFTLGQLNNLKYPGTDAVQGIMAEEGQDAGGNVVVRIFATNGQDTLIQLSATVCSSTNPTQSQNRMCVKYIKKCDKPSGLDEQCYRKGLIKDKILQKQAADKAKELLKTFALQ